MAERNKERANLLTERKGLVLREGAPGFRTRWSVSPLGLAVRAHLMKDEGR